MDNEKKVQRMVDVARMYYHENVKQEEIAKTLDISRPLVSKILTEAHETGIVTVIISSPINTNASASEEIAKKLNLNSVTVINREETLKESHRKIAIQVANLLGKKLENISKEKESVTLALGWGPRVYEAAEYMQNENIKNLTICPLIGNFPGYARMYHSDEIVDLMAEKTSGKPVYIYAPGFMASDREIMILKDLENYKEIEQAWENIDVLLISLRDYPSQPDFNTEKRFGIRLDRQKAVGEIAGYYFDITGRIIHGNDDYMIHAPLEVIKEAKHKIVVVQEGMTVEGLIGATKAGFVTDLVIDEDLAQETLLKLRAGK